jgi:hypothetical protein
MTLLVAGYIATDIWLYAFSKMPLTDSLLLDVFATMGFLVLGTIAHVATRGEDDAS